MTDTEDGDGLAGTFRSLLEETLCFTFGLVVVELNRDIDLRARGRGRNPISRFCIYLAAFARDLIRIPSHAARGIGQAQFRARVSYIMDTAIPVLDFHRERYPLDDEQRRLMDAARSELERGVSLISDGPVKVLDEWYATMDEFGELTDCSRNAAGLLAKAAGLPPPSSGPTAPSPVPGA